MLGGHARPRQSVEDRELRGTPKRKLPSCPTWRGGSSIFNSWRMRCGTPLPAVIKGYATPRDSKLTESSFDKVVIRTGGSYDCDDVMRAVVRLDRPDMRPGTSGQNGKTVPIFFTDREADAPAPGSEVWIQPSIDTGTRSSMHFKRTSISARTERRRSHASERSRFLLFSKFPTKVRRRPWKRTKCHRYFCRLDEPSDILDTGPFERSSTLHRRLEASSVPDVVQVAESRDCV